jgi:Transposase IS66 family/Transposase
VVGWRRLLVAVAVLRSVGWIVEETLETGSSVARMARKHGINANQVFQWRRLYRSGHLGGPSSSGLKLLAVTVRDGKTKTGRLWTYVRDDRPSGDTTAPAVWFAYSPDHKGEHPRLHLKLYHGALQADAYADFHHLYEGGRIYEAACWAHARRKFHEIHIAHASPTTSEAIERIAALYAIEAEIRGSTPEIRKTIRQARARPLIDSMHAWFETTLVTLSRKSDTAAAIAMPSRAEQP